MTKYKTYIVIFFLFLFSPLLSNESKVLSIGKSEAKVVVKVFSSLTCPHCASFHNKIYQKLKDEYIDSGKVRFEHHGFPLDLAALNAEKVLRSIENPEKSFEFLGVIYKKQNIWAVGSDIIKINNSITKISIEFGLNKNVIKNALDNEEIQDRILEERIDAQKKYKLSSTPTIYINEKKYEGKHEFQEFKKGVEKFL